MKTKYLKAAAVAAMVGLSMDSVYAQSATPPMLKCIQCTFKNDDTNTTNCKDGSTTFPSATDCKETDEVCSKIVTCGEGKATKIVRGCSKKVVCDTVMAPNQCYKCEEEGCNGVKADNMAKCANGGGSGGGTGGSGGGSGDGSGSGGNSNETTTDNKSQGVKNIAPAIFLVLVAAIAAFFFRF